MNRRTFVSSLAAAGAVAALPSRVIGQSASSRPKVGLIGCGWFGGVNLEALGRVATIEVVSLCDPNSQALQTMLGKVGAMQSAVPKTFSDYREMLSASEHDIVIIGTPDHWHALPGIEAMKAGADIYIEKPISVDVVEGEALVAAARKYGRVAQVNLQRRSMAIFHEARDKYLDTERLGKIGLVECFFYGGGSGARHQRVEPPSHLDYELWAGPAPKVPYVAPIEARGWRQFMEYGNGTMGDVGVHTFDLIRFLLDLKWPDSINSTGGRYVFKEATANISDTQRTVFRYPDLDVSWEHRHWGKSPIPQRHWTDQWGARIIGERGTLSVTTLSYVFESADGRVTEGRHLLSGSSDLENIDFGGYAKAHDAINDRHAENFMQARASGSRPVSDIEEGHISSACCILGNLALELGRPLAYDPAARVVTGDDEATRRLARAYRGPWIHPDPAQV